MNEGENHALAQWREDIEVRAQGGRHGVRRGTRVGKAKAADVWRAEGRDQCAGQMDIWGCIEQAEQDEEEAS